VKPPEGSEAVAVAGPSSVSPQRESRQLQLQEPSPSPPPTLLPKGARPASSADDDVGWFVDPLGVGGYVAGGEIPADELVSPQPRREAAAGSTTSHTSGSTQQQQQQQQQQQSGGTEGSVVPDAIGRETCPICIVDFEEGDDLRVLPCEGKHRFHQSCVDPWLLELSSSCPICRQGEF
jgi:hypothetical protein